MSHPYRTPASQPERPLAWLASRVPPSLDWLFRGFCWYRRALGGTWLLHCALLLPGAPEAWIIDGESSCSGFVVAREVWP